MKKLLLIPAFFLTVALSAQHEHHQHGQDTMKNNKSTQAPKSKRDHQHQHDSMSAPMSHAYSLYLPMTRNGSGTAWLPDSSVMYGLPVMTDKWMFMFHYNLFLRYNKQDVFGAGTRGGEKADAPNMFMFMGQRRVGAKGLFHFSSMFSFDPFTVGADGYPLLFQSGETYNGQPLVDRQHPHDLISELSIGYTHAFSRNTELTGYFGFPGEPTLGPVAFMHRVSALNNPDAPLGHHWQDATHITVGVASIGLRVHDFKAEASIFSGREPDEQRYQLDRPSFDSYAFRLMYNPDANFAFQVSQAFINSPEWSHPQYDVARTTASVIHHQPLARDEHYVASSIVWGYNNGHTQEHSVLAESNLQLGRTAVYGRYEWVQKNAEELSLEESLHDQQFNIQSFTAGASYIVLQRFRNNLAVGAQATVYSAHALENIYGNNPVSAEVYLRLYPQRMRM